jgi:hypothetical protein
VERETIHALENEIRSAGCGSGGRSGRNGSVENVTWQSNDGTRIEGVLHKPKDFDPKKKVSAAHQDSWRTHGAVAGRALVV